MNDKITTVNQTLNVLNNQYKWTMAKMRECDDAFDKEILQASAEIIGEEFFALASKRNELRKQFRAV